MKKYKLYIEGVFFESYETKEAAEIEGVRSQLEYEVICG